MDAVLGTIPVELFVSPCLEALKGYSNVDEIDLIAHTPTVVRILRTFSSRDQAAISRCVAIMSEGMSHFHHRQTHAGLKDLAEFEEYCYVVAGVVGELLTTIFGYHSPEFARHIHGKEQLALAFGQALQMTNILKDSPDDRARGVSWKPAQMSQTQLLVIAYEKLQDSLRYIILIPKKEVGMRRFCLLALGLAVMTLDKIAARQKFGDKAIVKLSRNTVWIFYGFTKLAASSDLLMKLFFKVTSGSLQRLAEAKN